MNKSQFFFCALVCTLMLTSCGNSYKYFTQSMYDENGWTERDLQRIQFYVSQDIVLYRKLSGEDTRITKGKIRVVDGSEIEEIIIERGTPGVFVQSPKANRFGVSFESNNRNFLMFGPNPKANGRFVLLAKDWDKRSGKVTYGDQVYDTSSQSAYAALMVDIKKAKKIKYKTKKAEGSRVN